MAFLKSTEQAARRDGAYRMDGKLYRCFQRLFQDELRHAFICVYALSARSRPLVLGLFWVVVAAAVSAQPTRAPEYSIKAAYLYNFAQFIEWPGDRFVSATAPIVIAVLGEDPFGAALDQAVKDKTAHGRPFEIRRVKQIGELKGCHILFVCASEAKRLPEILEAIKRSGLLAVSDIERFAEQGGIISFTMENNKVRFEVNMNAAAAADLRISAQLLRLAKKVWRVGEIGP